MKYEPISPDGIPIQPDLCDSREEAQRVIDRFVDRIVKLGSGYYAGGSARLRIEDIAANCTILEVDDGEARDDDDEDEPDRYLDREVEEGEEPKEHDDGE